MGDAKPWQIALIVLGVIAAGFAIWKVSTSNKISQSDRLLSVCVVTGEVFEIRLGSARGLMYPARHPQTGERTLFPVSRDGSSWVVDQNFREAASARETPGSKVSPSGLIEVSNSQPTVFTLRK